MELILEIGSYIFWILLALTILVFVHEMGHFLAAKLFGMKVDRFSVGFPPKIYGKQIGETEYQIGATPLGGYVKIAGMVDESMDRDQMEAPPDPRDFRAKPVWQRIIVITAGVIFNVILAFVIFFGLKLAYGETYIPADNVEEVYVADNSLASRMGFQTGDKILAVNDRPVTRFPNVESINLVSPDNLTMDRMTVTVLRDGERDTLLAPEDLMEQLKDSRGFGISALPSLVSQVVEGSAADSLGIQRGDRILAINGEPAQYWLAMTEALAETESNAVTVRWRRPDSLFEPAKPIQFSGEVTEQLPGMQRADDPPTHPDVVEKTSEGYIFQATTAVQDTAGGVKLGVYAADVQQLTNTFGLKHEQLGVGEALVSGVEETVSFTEATVTSLARVFTGRDDFTETVGGPVAIAKITKSAAEAGPLAFWQIVAFLSITLAIINILPIPALDGGHLMFLIYEGITRREPSLKVRMAMQQAGMLLLLAFMVFVIFNDIVQL